METDDIAREICRHCANVELYEGVLPNTKHIIIVVNLTSDDNGRVVGGSLKLRFYNYYELHSHFPTNDEITLVPCPSVTPENHDSGESCPNCSTLSGSISRIISQLRFNNQDQLTFRGYHIAELTMEKN
ncbi:hypothetical protein HZH68_003810 [Vespula germanica]|uniref:Uncharacterized protein n=1 Tax=Vespula germanica TaxID=30212 RepID=A0A834NIU5_VESGE|nr:hypothetical protein HZH68_003810 [Vespula germanica]